MTSVFKSLLTSNNQTPIMLTLEQVMRMFEQLPIEDLNNFWNPLKCREDLLPYLASQLGVTNWDNTWGITQKRQVCLNAILVSKHKGTVGALKRALASLGFSTEVIEWFNNNGTPMTAEVILHETDVIYNQQQYTVIYEVISDVKRLAVHIVFSKRIPVKGNYYIAGSYNQVSKWRIANG